MRKVSGRTRFVKDEEIVSRSIEGETVLVPIREKMGDLGSIYTLNRTAARIWELIDGKRGVAAIARQIVREFDVEDRKAESDLLSLLTELEEIGAVRRVEG